MRPVRTAGGSTHASPAHLMWAWAGIPAGRRGFTRSPGRAPQQGGGATAGAGEPLTADPGLSRGSGASRLQARTRGAHPTQPLPGGVPASGAATRFSAARFSWSPAQCPWLRTWAQCGGAGRGHGAVWWQHPAGPHLPLQAASPVHKVEVTSWAGGFGGESKNFPGILQAPV